MRLNVEIKGSGADGLLTLPLAVEALRRHGLCDETVLSSFHEPILRRAAADAPDIARAFIFDARIAGDGLAIARANGCEAVHPQHGLVDEAMIARCRDAGLRVRAWTVNEPADVLRMMALQADGIVSDDTGRVRELRDTMPAS